MTLPNLEQRQKHLKRLLAVADGCRSDTLEAREELIAQGVVLVALCLNDLCWAVSGLGGDIKMHGDKTDPRFRGQP